jgi:hypothetical protein
MIEQLVEINTSNGVWKEPARTREFWVAVNEDASEPDSYPCDVLDVDGNVIGTASDKDEYMSIWNDDANNRFAKGYLIGDGNPFVFMVKKARETLRGGFLSEDEHHLFTTEDGKILILE